MPNQYWHLDQSLLRLKNGTKIYIRAIIDNFSRYVLAWQVTDDSGGIRTKELITKALEVSKDLLVGTEIAKLIPNIIVDDGSENSNEHVDSLITLGLILRTIAQIDIVQSNSLIEALFLALKHRWLFLQSLDTLEQVIRYVEKYLLDHNNLIPRVALRGATPQEMFLGKWTTDDDLKLLQHSEQARQQRKVANLTFSCGACPV
jgi:transposase InsO family protein